MMRSLLLSLLMAAPALLASPAAMAQDGVDSLDREDSSDDGRDRGNRRDVSDGEVREVTKGFYAKANVGGAGYLLGFRGFVNTGTAVGLSVGKDFLDRETKSAAWEVNFVQGVHNGCHYERQADFSCPGNASQASPYVQGDLRTYLLTASGEYSIYPNRRFGIGMRASVGLLGSPLLMNEEEYLRVVLPEWGLAADPGYHGTGPLGLDKPHPLVGAGPTIEYYSKLAHFSVGVDVDVFYAIGFDLGLNGTGYLKYTF